MRYGDSIDFEWDEKKNILSVKKDGVSFEEATTCFKDPHGFVLEDTKHSTLKEERFFWIGKSLNKRILTIRFTFRGPRKIRIIGAAEWREFRKLYYEKTKTK